MNNTNKTTQDLPSGRSNQENSHTNRSDRITCIFIALGSSLLFILCFGISAVFVYYPDLLDNFDLPATMTATPSVPTCSPYCGYTDMTVGFLPAGMGGDWREANDASFSDTAEELGITLKVYDARIDYNKQLDGFRKFLDDPEINVIVLVPIEGHGWTELLEEARDKGKVVIMADHSINGNEDLYATMVGNDNYEHGRMAGAELCRLLEDSPTKFVWEIQGYLGSPVSIDINQGFTEVTQECGIRIYKAKSANWRYDESKAIISEYLQETEKIDGLFAYNENMLFGAMDALIEAGYSPAEDVKLVSIGSSSYTFIALQDETLNAAIENSPDYALQVYDAALAALNEEELPGFIPVDDQVFRMEDPGLPQTAEDREY